MSDEFIREVDEAVRHDELKRLWDKFGVYVLLGAALIVAGVAGYKGWRYWEARQAAKTGARFVGALILEEEGKSADALAAFKDLAASGPAGYRTLSRFQLAEMTAKAGKRAEAVKMYDQLAADTSVGEVLRSLARIKAAALLVDTAGLEDMKARIDALTGATNTWRHSARELLGLTAYREGNRAEAERYFTRMLVDPGVPTGMRARAQIMLALVVKADEPAAPDAAKPK